MAPLTNPLVEIGVAKLSGHGVKVQPLATGHPCSRATGNVLRDSWGARRLLALVATSRLLAAFRQGINVDVKVRAGIRDDNILYDKRQYKQRYFRMWSIPWNPASLKYS